ncbi:uroporphyrinogen decarboxylase/cobalamine-independent methonine synthase family protein [Nigerium massiliense]|uniref:hypothetical protein n=1 Tax=Nigerium massiliense TaxID=1522317 RepID=UPI00058BE2EB|nr:hypothetical protein [Nigerium massiliense]
MSGVAALGSLPGTDAGAAVRLMFEATPDLPCLPELPARGPWAGMIGRSCALLSGLATELSAGQWKLAPTAGIDARRARATLRDDLDVLEENAQGYEGPFKIQVAGPWTLAAALFRPLGGRVLGDRGARRDVGQSLAAGVADLLGELRRRLPGLDVRLQVDEPSLPAVLTGAVPTEGGYFRHRRVEAPEVAETLAAFGALTPGSVAHCCAAGVPVELLTHPGRDGAGFAGISLDAALVGDLDPIADAVERGIDLFWGVTSAPEPANALTGRVLAELRPLELGETLADRLWLTPSCGLAGLSAPDVTRVLSALRTASDEVQDALRS